jgi:hypothetical protein
MLLKELLDANVISNDLTATQLHSKLPQDDMELLIEAQVSESRLFRHAQGSLTTA